MISRKSKMARFKRIVAINRPHHITNRGNRRQTIFFSDEDRKFYVGLLHKYGNQFGLKFWAYCLMPNHIHLVAVPEKPDSMALAIREAHRKYSMYINLRMKWQGTLWQQRYYSSPLEDAHLYRALRYVENNPVRAGMVKKAELYPWSSAPAHIFGNHDDLLSPNGFGMRKRAWKAYLREREEEAEIEDIRARTITGRPLGGDEFINQLEISLERDLRHKKTGRKKQKGNSGNSKPGSDF